MGASVQPLVDMVTNLRDPDLQAEALTSLAIASEKKQNALELCKPEVFVAFEKIMRAAEYKALFPMTQVLNNLTPWQREAEHCFAEQVFWQALLQSTVAQSINLELQKKFAHVVGSVRPSQEQVSAMVEVINCKMIAPEISDILHDAFSNSTAV